MAGLLEEGNPDIFVRTARRQRGVSPVDLGRGLLGWAKDNPFDAAAMAVSPVPILGDIAGLANDVRSYAADPETITPSNLGLTAAGMLPFVPSFAGMAKGIGRAAERARGSVDVEDYFGNNFRVLQNPSPQETKGFLRRTKHKAARRLVDKETGDVYLWDGDTPALHGYVAEKFGIKITPETIADVLFWDD